MNVPVGILLPDIFCPVPSSRCVRILIVPPVPPEVAAADIVIVPLSELPITSIEFIVVDAGIPVPIIEAPTIKFVVVIFYPLL